MFVKQISVFLENKPGTLRELTQLLGGGGVDLLALSIADTQNFGIVRIIVNSEIIDPALKILRDNGYTAKVNNVICAAVPDRPLGLCELLTLIDQAGLSVEYMYSFLRAANEAEAYMILRLSDGEKGMQMFQVRNVHTLTQEDVDAM